MEFIPISVDGYVKKYIENNPLEDEKEFRNKLSNALRSFHRGVKCSCGNDIWVIGSAYVGNRCFSCITGESAPSDDYEIESALNKTLV